MIRIVSIMSMVFVCLVIFLPTVQAEESEYTRCISGTVTLFHRSQEAPPVLSWAESGITMSDDTMFNNMTIHCEGVQMGLEQNREGYGLCKATDLDGDMIISGGPYAAPPFSSKIVLGTGKWKGIKGTLAYRRIVKSKPRKGAMPFTYQACHRVKVTFELPPK